MSERRTEVTLNISEAKDEIKDFIKVNEYNLAKGIDKKIAISLSGAPGLGKTACVKQAAEEEGIGFVTLRMSQLDELADLVGYPIVKYDMIRTIKEEKDSDGKIITKASKEQTWVDKSMIDVYVAAGWQPGHQKAEMGYAAPEWIANMEDEKFILFLDDWTGSNPRFIQAK